jgi:hypothetical protein
MYSFYIESFDPQFKMYLMDIFRPYHARFSEVDVVMFEISMLICNSNHKDMELAF